MYWNPNYEFFAPSGWRCPGCGRIYSPNTSECPYCGGNNKPYYSTSTNYEWIYKPGEPTSGWFNDYLKFIQADSSGNIDNSKTVTWNNIDSKMIDELLRSDFFDNNNLWEKPL